MCFSDLPSTSHPHNLSPLARLPIPTFHPTTTVLSHLVALLAAWSDRGAELLGSWGAHGTLAALRKLIPYPSPNDSPRVNYTDLELDSDLTLGTGDHKIGSGTTTIHLGMGMSDLGERLMMLVLTLWCWWKSDSRIGRFC